MTGYREEQDILARGEPPAEQSFATVGTVHPDGIALVFDGEETESLKHYKCNAYIPFAPGQRVRIIRDSGTYVVEYPVGNPAGSVTADYAARAGYASEAGTAGTAGRAATAGRADSAMTADKATRADQATAAGRADTAATADRATNADNATSAGTANIAIAVADNDDHSRRILISANTTKNHFYMWAPGMGDWRQIDN